MGFDYWVLHCNVLYEKVANAVIVHCEALRCCLDYMSLHCPKERMHALQCPLFPKAKLTAAGDCCS